ncbi:hypothetical protein [Oleiharenicola sp. Vm1]|uniref:hypothetical protein n=1 Tax=Oleiharenicola sp. Vm1 TaxID=3398393 RepID=UPI0039F4C1D8
MIHDLKFALRSLAKTPGTSLAFIFILALGVGANTAVFSVVEAVLLRSLPYERPRELVAVRSAAASEVGLLISPSSANTAIARGRSTGWPRSGRSTRTWSTAARPSWCRACGCRRTSSRCWA